MMSQINLEMLELSPHPYRLSFVYMDTRVVPLEKQSVILMSMTTNPTQLRRLWQSKSV